MRRPKLGCVAGFIDGHVTLWCGQNGVRRFVIERGGDEGRGQSVDIDHRADTEKGTRFFDRIVASGPQDDAQLGIGGEGGDGHGDVVALLAPGRDEGNGAVCSRGSECRF